MLTAGREPFAVPEHFSTFSMHISRAVTNSPLYLHSFSDLYGGPPVWPRF